MFARSGLHRLCQHGLDVFFTGNSVLRFPLPILLVWVHDGGLFSNGLFRQVKEIGMYFRNCPVAVADLETVGVSTNLWLSPVICGSQLFSCALASNSYCTSIKQKRKCNQLRGPPSTHRCSICQLPELRT